MGGHWTNVTFNSRPFGTVRFPKPLDMAWITQNYHDLKVPEFHAGDTVAFDRAVYAALKPGGIYFVIDHQGRPGMTAADYAKLHRIDRDLVVREVTSAGFKLAGEGTFLRNPADTHTLPLRQIDPGPHRSIRPEVREAELSCQARAAVPSAAATRWDSLLSPKRAERSSGT